MKIHQFITIITATLLMLALTRFGFADNPTRAKEIREVLNDESVKILLKETSEATGGDHVDFGGITYSKDQRRDGKHRYDLQFEGEKWRCFLTVKYNIVTNKIDELTKEEVREALLGCLGF